MQLSTDWKRSSTLVASKIYTNKENKWNKPTKITYNNFFCKVKIRQKKKKYKEEEEKREEDKKIWLEDHNKSLGTINCTNQILIFEFQFFLLIFSGS